MCGKSGQRKGNLIFLSVLFAALSLGSSLCFAQPLSQDAPPQQELSLEELGSLVHTSLDSLTSHSKSLTEELEAQSSRAEGLQAKLNGLVICLDNTNKQLSDFVMKYERSETKRKALWKVVWALLGFDVLVFIYLLLEKKGVLNFI